MRIHLFVDWENKSPTGTDLAQVRGAEYRLWILHGPHQKNFGADQFKAVLPLGDQVRVVQGIKSGRNAMDLHIAFYVGKAREQDRNAGVQGCYVIVSGDKDFDPLLAHLTSKEEKAGRADSIPKALQLARTLVGGAALKPSPKAQPRPAPRPQPRAVPKPQPKPQPRPQARPLVSAHATRVMEGLANPKRQPTTVKRLLNYIGSVLGKENSPAAVDRVVAELKALKVVTVDGTKPGYDIRKK
jgi:hypothetical protein